MFRPCCASKISSRRVRAARAVWVRTRRFLRAARPRCHSAAGYCVNFTLCNAASLGTRASYRLSGARHLLRAIGSLQHIVLRLAFGARLLQALNRGKIRRQILIKFNFTSPAVLPLALLCGIGYVRVFAAFKNLIRPKRLAFGRNMSPQTAKFAHLV